MRRVVLVCALSGCGQSLEGTHSAQGTSSAGPPMADSGAEDSDEAYTTDDSSDASDSSGGDGSPTPTDLPRICGGASFDFLQPRVSVVWLVDRSVSTLVPFDHDQDPETPMVTAAERIEAAMAQVTAAYPPTNGCGSHSSTLMFFPNDDAPPPPAEESCAVMAPATTTSMSTPSTLAQLWSERPSPAGSAPLESALQLAAADAHGSLDGNDHKNVVALVGSPGGCGAGSEDPGLSLSQLAEMTYANHGARTYFVNAGPSSGSSGTQTDGVANDIDYEQAWLDLSASRWPAVGPESIEFVLGWLAGEFINPVPSCALDVSFYPNFPPAPGMATPKMLINGETYYELPISPLECLSEEAPDGFAWDESRTTVYLCAGACSATRCNNLPPYPDNTLNIEIPYQCDN